MLVHLQIITTLNTITDKPIKHKRPDITLTHETKQTQSTKKAHRKNVELSASKRNSEHAATR